MSVLICPGAYLGNGYTDQHSSFHGSASDGKVIHYIRKPVPGYHPERRFVPHGVPVDAAGLVQYDAAGNKGPPIPLAPDAMERTAFKLGRTIRHLTHAIAADANPAGEQAASMNRQNAFVADNVNTRNSTSLFDPVLGIRFNEGARERNLAKLQDKLIMECNRNWSQLNPEPDHARNWAFERELDDATRKDFFAFDRWPVEFQSPERQREIIHSVPWTAQVLPPRLGGHVDDGGRDDHHHHHHRLQRLAQARELRIRRRRHRHHHAGHHHDAHDADRDRFGDGHHLDDHHHHDDHHGHPRGTKRKADDQPVHGPPARVRWRDPRAPPTDGDNRRERYFRGQTVFPFGETPIQQAWQSMQIDNDLRDGKSISTSLALYITRQHETLTRPQHQNLHTSTKRHGSSVFAQTPQLRHAMLFHHSQQIGPQLTSIHVRQMMAGRNCSLILDGSRLRFLLIIVPGMLLWLRGRLLLLLSLRSRIEVAVVGAVICAALIVAADYVAGLVVIQAD